MFTVETVSGDEVLRAETLDSATVWARNALEDDPEVGSLEIWENGVQRRTVTFGPDADWQSVVVVLEPGEKVQPPEDPLVVECDNCGAAYPIGKGWNGKCPNCDDEEDAYDPSDPKSAGYHDRMAAIWDDREKF